MVPFHYNLDCEVIVLLNFVLSRSQDRITQLNVKGVFETDKDALLIDRFKDFYFKAIEICDYRNIFNDLVRSHFSRSKWTKLELTSNKWPVPILHDIQNHVLSPDFHSLVIDNNDPLLFGFDIFESIFQKFVENKWLGERTTILNALFEKRAKNMLRTYRPDLSLRFGRMLLSDDYCWRNQSGQNLRVGVSSSCCWRIYVD